MDLRAIVTMCLSQDSLSTWSEGVRGKTRAHFALFVLTLVTPRLSQCCCPDLVREVFGLLVALGFGIAAFTPAPYQRARLARP